MDRMRKALRYWLAMAAVWSGAVAARLLGEHQLLRLQANDPQVQLAEDAARALAAGADPKSVLPPGPEVDVARSLAPFVVVYDAAGAPIASSGRLHGAAPRLPGGVLEHARAQGGHRLSWQPEVGVRQALVVVPLRAAEAPGFVVAGRSLREVEARKRQALDFLLLLWALGLGGLLPLALLLPGPSIPEEKLNRVQPVPREQAARS
jgi:hypothetical protein